MNQSPFLLTLSPAKRFHAEETVDSEPSIPHFLQNADELVTHLKTLSTQDLCTLMHISETIAELNVKRFKDYRPQSYTNGTPAAYLFAGDAYRGLEFSSLTTSEKDYAQSCLIILSGLYGILRPLDLIQPYRLEMGCRLQSYFDFSLYDYWRPLIAEQLNKLIYQYGFRYHLNLSSSEYAKSINTEALHIPTIDLVFGIRHEQSFKVVGVKAKKARGLMTRFLIKSQIQTLEQVQSFNHGYLFCPALSTAKRFVFLET